MNPITPPTAASTIAAAAAMMAACTPGSILATGAVIGPTISGRWDNRPAFRRPRNPNQEPPDVLYYGLPGERSPRRSAVRAHCSYAGSAGGRRSRGAKLHPLLG